MSGNIRPLIRYRAIDKCLNQKGRAWGWEALSVACGELLRYYLGEEINDPSRRTIMADINTMRHGKLGYHAPIVYDRREKTFAYADPGFSIRQSPVSEEVLFELRQALIIIQQYRGFEEILGLESITTQLEYSLLLQTRNEPPIIQFDHPLEAPGQEYLNELFHHVRLRQPLAITYHPFNFAEAYDALVSPYLLKEYNKRWNLIGYNHGEARVEVFPLDRIKRLEKVHKRFVKSRDFDPATYFGQVIGPTVLRDRPLCRILFRAIPEQARYIQTKPLHTSQRIEREEADGSIVFSFELIPNFELESLLLSFGERIEVLEPEDLRRRIGERLEEAGRLYRG